MTTTMLLIILIMSFLPIMLTPISLGLWIIILAMLIALNMSFIMSSWFSYILFLIYIGGLLVMFAYFVAIDPNKKIKMLDPIFIPMTISITLLIMSSKTWTITTMEFSNMSTPLNTNLLLTELFPILMLMASSLLLILISVVKITNRSLGTLRPFIKYV